jgi:hypothetical protein
LNALYHLVLEPRKNARIYGFYVQLASWPI